MTWRELAAHIAALPSEARNTDATVFDSGTDEWFMVTGGIMPSPNNGVLDEGHPYITI